ncbi:Group 2 truncated hemoglobin YjbI [compost metagenome]
MITNLYEAIGGDETIRRLVNAFYPRVAADPDLSPIFPADLSETVEKQRLFLTQFLGGPALYTQTHGNPRMRARHLPFEITPTRREAWLRNMAAAMDEIGLEGALREEFFERLRLTAHHMENSPEP